MHRFIFVLIVALLATATIFLGGLDNGAARAEGTFTIVLNEIAAASSSDHEWIEVVNRSSIEIDLTGWKFYEDNTNHSLTLVQGSFILPAGMYGVIADNASYFLADYPDFTGTLFDSSWGSLNNDGEFIGLKDSGGVFLEQFTYLPVSDASLERIDFMTDDYTTLNWCERESGASPGTVNDGCGVALLTSSENVSEDVSIIVVDDPTDESVVVDAVSQTPFSWSVGDILLSEIFPQPAEDQEEWVELFVSREGLYDLSGLVLSDATGAQFSLSGSATGPGFVVITGFSFSLNNDAETLTLSTDDGTVLDTMQYGTDVLVAPVKAQSIGRTENGWGFYPIPTPGVENIFTNTPPTPVVTLQSGEWTGFDSLTLNVSAESSFDSDGDAFIFLWDFGDGVTSDRSNPSAHTYTVGNYTLSLTVTDVWGTSATVSQAVSVSATIVSDHSSSSSTASTSSSSSALSSDTSFVGGSSVTAISASSTTSEIAVSSTEQNFTDIPLFLTEIFPNPPGKDAGFEWIEILNDSDVKIDLSGWSLRNDAAKPRVIRLPEIFLDPHMYTVVTLSGSFLRNRGDTLFLIAPDEGMHDTLSYDAAPESESYALDASGEFSWTSFFTPGEENFFPEVDDSQEDSFEQEIADILTTSTSVASSKSKKKKSYQNGDLSSAIYLNEILPNPEGEDRDGEWIEISNMSDVPVNLGNWFLDDGEGGSKPYIIPDTFIIAPFETLLFSRRDTGLTLDNTGDTVQLFTFESDLQDFVTYANVQENGSYARIAVDHFFLLDDQQPLVHAATVEDQLDAFWQWTTHPTPGAENPTYTVVRGTVQSWDGTILSLRLQNDAIFSLSVLDTDMSLLFDALFIEGAVLDLTYWDSEGVFVFVTAESVVTNFDPPQNGPSAGWLFNSLGILFFGSSIFVFTLLVHRRKVRQAAQVPLSLSGESVAQVAHTVLPPVLENQFLEK